MTNETLCSNMFLKSHLEELTSSGICVSNVVMAGLCLGFVAWLIWCLCLVVVVQA